MFAETTAIDRETIAMRAKVAAIDDERARTIPQLTWIGPQGASIR
jgi:hypothetical protein